MRFSSSSFPLSLILLILCAAASTAASRRLGHSREQAHWKGLPTPPGGPGILHNVFDHLTDFRAVGTKKTIPVLEQPCECVSNKLPVKVNAEGDGHIQYKMEDGEVRQLPTNYGEMCKAWEEQTDPECESEFPPGYCSQKWCYVDKECKAKDTKQSLFFKDQDHLYYSYVNCGSFDGFTAQACTKHEDEAKCTEPCAWNGEHGCQNALCQCTGDNAALGEVDTMTFGDSYGTTCKAWDTELCEKKNDKGELGLWCCQRWCYVDESCPSAQQSPLNEKLYFSYHTCPDKVEEMLKCPYKKPVDVNGDPVPLSTSVSKALAEHTKEQKEKERAKQKSGAAPLRVVASTAALASIVLALLHIEF